MLLPDYVFKAAAHMDSSACTSNGTDGDGICGFCRRPLVIAGEGRQTLECRHVVHERCLWEVRRRGYSKGGCPNCGLANEDVATARELFQQGVVFFTRGWYADAARCFSASLELQHHIGCAGLLGFLYKHGQGLEKDLRKALTLLTSAHNAGDCDATCELADMYACGIGMNKNLKKGLEMLREAQERGFTKATFFLATLASDREEHIRLLKVVSRTGDMIDADAASCLLGKHYLDQSDPKLKRKEESLALLAFAMGDSTGMASLVLADHVKRTDLATAHKYWDTAFARALKEGVICALAAWQLGLGYLDDRNAKNAGLVSNSGLGVALLLLAHDAGHKDASCLPQLFMGQSIEDLKMSMHYMFFSEFLAFVRAGTSHKFPAWSCSPAALSTLLPEQFEDKFWKGNDIMTDFMGRLANRPTMAPTGPAAAMATNRQEEILILEYSRHPLELEEALLQHPSLEACRQALAMENLSFKLEGGAKIFVKPAYYEAVIKALEGKELKPWLVIVAAEFEQAVGQAVASLPSRMQVRQKKRSMVAVAVSDRHCEHCGKDCPRFKCTHCSSTWYCSQDCQRRDWKFHKAAGGDLLPVVVKRTFLHLDVPSSLRSEPSTGPKTQSTSDANPRVKVNPRKA